MKVEVNLDWEPVKPVARGVLAFFIVMAFFLVVTWSPSIFWSTSECTSDSCDFGGDVLRFIAGSIGLIVWLTSRAPKCSEGDYRDD